MKRLALVPKSVFFVSAILLLYCFAGFCYDWDIRHTVTSSYAILNGHFRDFYAYNQSIPSIGGNDYEISVYLVFAIWNIPTKLAGFARPEVFPLLVMLYNKLLVCILFALCSWCVYRIGSLLFKDEKTALFAAASFFLCPIALFGPFIFTQYDSIYVLIMLAGTFLLLRGEGRRDDLLGVVLFGISILFKPFALIGFIPLMLYKNKNILRLLLSFVIVILPTVAVKLVFTGAGGGVSFLSRLFESSILVNAWGNFKISLFPVLYMMLCMGCYFLEVSPDRDRQRRTAIYILYMAYAVFFSFVLWHPMWLLVMMPFFILTTVSSPRRIPLLLVEIALTAGFAGTVLVSWGTTIAEDLLSGNTFRYLGERLTGGIDVSDLPPIAAFPFFSLFVAALFVDLYLKFPITKQAREPLPPITPMDWRYRTLTFCVGILGCTLPALVSYFFI